MPIEPRPRRKGTADEAAALAFAAAGSSAEAAEAPTHRSVTDCCPEPAPAATSDQSADAVESADASAHDLRSAREERIRRVLDFEAGWTSHGGAKARAIRAEFGWTTTRYYQVLDGLLETEAALRHDPMLVRRLIRLREGR